jgi:uncharacterized protein
MAQKYIRLEEISLDLDGSEEELRPRAAAILGLAENAIHGLNIVKKAIDSRNKSRILFVYSVDVSIKGPEIFMAANHSETVSKNLVRHKARLLDPYSYDIKTIDHSGKRPIIVGSGPSGLFCALALARAGLRPLVVERGKDVDSRVKDVNLFAAAGKLDPDSNVQFGEGGAGTFSDGKLYTLINDPRSKFVFGELIRAGAPAEIGIDAHPHIGTDRLRQVVKNIRLEILRLGGEVRFGTCLTDIEIENGRIAAAVLNEKERLETERLVLAIGHSARDTYRMIHDRELEMAAKPFSIGLRIEHRAEMINRAQYGKFFGHPKLGAARYKLVAHLPGRRSVYTFCMCPGGYIVPASSEEGHLAVNGMSEFARDGRNSNCALLVSVLPEDFGSDHPLSGVEFQRRWEKAAFLAGGGNYQAPIQLVGDFVCKKPSSSFRGVIPTYRPGVTPTGLDTCLPEYVIESIRLALPVMDRQVKGFAHPEAVLTGVETRSSSPVRITRDDSFQSVNTRGIYPAGEGAGYAGGIVSSAIDGLKVAESIINDYA